MHHLKSSVAEFALCGAAVQPEYGDLTLDSLEQRTSEDVCVACIARIRPKRPRGAPSNEAPR